VRTFTSCRFADGAFELFDPLIEPGSHEATLSQCTARRRRWVLHRERAGWRLFDIAVRPKVMHTPKARLVCDDKFYPPRLRATSFKARPPKTEGSSVRHSPRTPRSRLQMDHSPRSDQLPVSRIGVHRCPPG
jgi:hypothetical protein